MFDEYDLEYLVKKHGIVLSKLYAHSGPRNRGIKYFIFAQFAPLSSVAGCINAACHLPFQKRSAANCVWDSLRITPEHLERYPAMQRIGMTVSDSWPCIRTTREVQASEELLVSTFGAGFWQRYERESNWERWENTELYRLKSEEKVRTTSSSLHRQGGGTKRARDSEQ